VNNKNSKNPRRPRPSPQKNLIWYKNKLLLGTPWVLEKKIGNSLGIQWDHGGNTLRTRKIQCPPFPQKKNCESFKGILDHIIG
jgi:hypothetical protein